ncbi:MAG: (Fe-S)-binding protein [Pseudomonadota bacterium]|nr:(Fe-S)-binding protein [Pseudomonadota bacterium]
MTDFMAALDLRTADTLNACTSCGKCVEVCPMAEPAGLDAGQSKSIVGGVLEFIRTGKGPEASARFANSCSGSGHCITACPEGVNPRFMLAMARAALRRDQDNTLETAKNGSAQQFRGVSRGVRVLSQLQLAPDQLRRMGQLRGGVEPENPDVLFYTGCNVLKTPHIVLLCLDILDALGITFAVRGGPSHCCGVFQLGTGDVEGFERMALRTIDKLAEAGGAETLSWCASCQVHLGDVALETAAPVDAPKQIDLSPFVIFLAGKLDELKPLMTKQVKKRVGLHEHPGVGGITEAARSLLEAIPGLEFVDLEQPRVGYMCNKINVLPDYKRDYHTEQLEAAEAAGVDTLAGIYHVCHRELCSHERDWPFEVVNFMELLGESMGIAHPDLFKRMKLMQDVDAIIADSADMIAEYDMDLDEVRAVVLKDMLNEQPLPLGRVI